jgi:formate-dependent nitrite reductase membrane component NrfD
MTSAWFQRSGVWVGGLMAATALYALLFSLFRPEKKMSNAFTNKKFRWLLIGMIVIGTLIAVSDIVSPQ